MTYNSNIFGWLTDISLSACFHKNYFQLGKKIYRITVRRNENKVHKAIHKPCAQYILLINISFFYYYFEKTQTSFTKHSNFS